MPLRVAWMIGGPLLLTMSSTNFSLFGCPTARSRA
jgi:hypothetical protein